MGSLFILRSKASPKLGGSASGLDYLRNLGVKNAPFYPALCPLTVNDAVIKSLKGIRTACKITLLSGNGEIKRAIKAALKAFKANPTSENLSKAQSEYDKAAKKGLIKKNTASRRKANLAKIAKANGSKPAAAKKATAAKAPAKKAA